MSVNNLIFNHIKRISDIPQINADNNPKQTIDEYERLFDKYAIMQKNLLKQLNAIFNINLSLNDGYHINLIDYIKNVCTDSDAANEAYKFYGRQIIGQWNQLSDYITESKGIIDQIKEDAVSADAVHFYKDRLDILCKFCAEIASKFSVHYEYNFKEDAWILVADNYEEGTHTQIKLKPESYDDLRTLEVNSNEDDIKKEGKKLKKPIEVYNELNLLDRLKYIKLYYTIQGKEGVSDYVFPENKALGIPCIADIKDEKTGAIEQFFMGYLIDKDSPLNAMASFLAVKTAALQENIKSLLNQIRVFNTYLNLLNRAISALNASQSSGYHRIPDGVMTAYTYLCCSTMYNLYEADNGDSYFVLESNYYKNKYWMIKSDESGMNFLLGDDASFSGYQGNGCTYNFKVKGGEVYADGQIYTACDTKLPHPKIPTAKLSEKIPGYFATKKDNTGRFIRQNETFKINKLPQKIDISKIIPQSVKGYLSLGDTVSDEKFSSWIQAFQDKVSYIDKAIKLVESDIQMLRNKVDTFDTMSNMFRNRTHDAYAKITSNIKK